MIIVKFKIDKKQFEDFDSMCVLNGEDSASKLRTMIAEELNLFRQQQEKRESRKKDGWVEIGVSHVIPPAY